MNLNKTSLTTLKTNQAVAIGASFEIVNNANGTNPIKLSLDNDEYIDVDLVIDAAMEAGTVINTYFYRSGVQIASAQTIMGAKAAGYWSNRVTHAAIQKADYAIVEVRLKEGAAAYNATAIFLTALNATDTLQIADISSFPDAVDFTIGTEAVNVINVACQFRDARLAAIAQVTPFRYYLSSDAAGTTPVAADTSVAIGTNGTITEVITAAQSGYCLTDASGQFDIDITETGVVTHYLNIVLPGGLVTSTAIAFV